MADHRGLYKGLGEEPKISKYEDYFVKRSLDSFKTQWSFGNGASFGLAESTKPNLKNADILEGFRLPNGAFAGTQVGTDIMILQKNIPENFYRYFQLF